MSVARQTFGWTGVQVEVQLVEGVADGASQKVVEGVACATQQVNLQRGEHQAELFLVEARTVGLGADLLREAMAEERKGRQTSEKKSTAPALQKGYNSLQKKAIKRFCTAEERRVYSR